MLTNDYLQGLIAVIALNLKFREANNIIKDQDWELYDSCASLLAEYNNFNKTQLQFKAWHFRNDVKKQQEHFRQTGQMYVTPEESEEQTQQENSGNDYKDVERQIDDTNDESIVSDG